MILTHTAWHTMYKIISIFFIFMFVSLSGCGTLPNKEYCEIDHDGSYWAAWEKCEGRLVKISGKKAKFAMQHPIGMYGTLDPQTGKIIREYQTYIDMGDSQIVITHDQKIECSGKIEVEGIVDIVDLGGKEGTKSSYKNVWIRVRSYKCR